jgi:hypothetical protein
MHFGKNITIYSISSQCGSRHHFHPSFRPCLSAADRFLAEGLLEDLEGGGGLVERHLVAGGIDLQPAEVVERLVQASALATDGVGLERLRRELRLAAPGDSIGDGKPTLVIADPV